MSGLFRDEALQARRTSHLGSIRIGRNPGFAVVTVVALALAAALVAFALRGEVTRKARLAGVLVPVAGTVPLASAAPGRIVDVRVREGEAVDTGQVLMAVATDRATAQGDAAVLVARSMEQRRATLVAERGLAEVQARQRAQALADRARSLEAEARQLEGELEGVGRRVELAQKSLERYRELARSGFVSEVQAQQRQEELLDLTSRRGTAERNLLAVRREVQSLRAEQAANESALRSQLVQFDRGIAGIEQEAAENTARRELVVAAPRAGTVTALVATRGQPVEAGQTLATLVPLGPDGVPSPLEAHLYAPSRSIGFVEVGQEVWIRYAAFPYQTFGLQRGTVAAVGRTPIGPRDVPAGVRTADEPLYRVVVALQDQAVRASGAVTGAHALRAGMALEADAVQERRKVWQWVFEPVLAASGLGQAVAGPAPAAASAAGPVAR